MIEPVHVRMARAALNWTLQDLERESGIGRNTISRYEIGKEIVASSLIAIEKTFLKQGIIFLEAGEGHGPGIRLKRQP